MGRGKARRGRKGGEKTEEGEGKEGEGRTGAWRRGRVCDAMLLADAHGK